MSKTSRNNDIALDVWSKLEREPPRDTASSLQGSSDPDTNPEQENEGKITQTAISKGYNSTIVFIGDGSCGKSTLIQTFLKPSAAKDTKPTIALEYSYARKTTNNLKSVTNIWEIGGDLIEPKLMEIPLTMKTLSSSVIIICCDLSKPHNVLNSVLKSITSIKEIIKQRTSELQASNVNELNLLRDNITNSIKNHPDVGRLRYLDVPIIIIGTKFDLFKSQPISDRRVIINVLRFISHYFGGTLMTMSNGSDTIQRDNYRSLISSYGFNLPIKVLNEINYEKHIFITRGQDNFHNILLGLSINNINKGPEMDATSSTNKNGIVNSEAEMDNFLTHKGVTRDCWGRLADYVANVFGEPDPLPTLGDDEGKEMESGDGDGGASRNPFPEAEIDDMRSVRDAALERYIKEMERQEELRQKMNARGSND